jgi:hypothetical protein
MFGLQNVQLTSRNSAAHLSTKQDDLTSIFSKTLILKEILCRSVVKTEKWTTLVHFSDDFVSFDNCKWLSMALSHLGLPSVDFEHGSSDEKGFVVRKQDVTTLATSESHSRPVVLRE